MNPKQSVTQNKIIPIVPYRTKIRTLFGPRKSWLFVSRRVVEGIYNMIVFYFKCFVYNAAGCHIICIY